MKTMSIYLLSTSFSWVEEDNLRIEDLQENKAIQHVLNDIDDEYLTPKIQKTTKENLSKSNVPKYELEKQSFYDVSSFPSNYDSHDVAENYSKHFDVRYICQICDLTFPHKDQLEQHQWIDHMNYPFSIITISSNSSQSEPFTEELDALTCKVCKIRFLEKRSLEKHKCIIHELDPSFKHFPPIETHSSSNMRFCCRICGKIILKRGNLKQHAIAHLRRNEKSPPSYCCEICPETFGKKLDEYFTPKIQKTTKENLSKSNVPEYELEKQSFYDVSSFPSNYDSHDVAENYSKHFDVRYICQICELTFPHKDQLEQHQWIDHMNYPFSIITMSSNSSQSEPFTEELDALTCKVCKIRFLEKRSLEKHKCIIHELDPSFKHFPPIETHSSSNMRFCCRICGKIILKRGNLKQHAIAHLRRNEKSPPSYCCEICPETFRKKLDLRRHIKLNHIKEQISMKKSSKSKRDLSLHETNSPPRNYYCEICPEIFGKKSDLRRHVKLNHIKEQISKEKSSKSKRGLKHETKDTCKKSEEGPYKCTTCEKSYTTKGSLKYHILVHAGIKEYSCDICKRSFTHKGNLKTHLRTHTGEKPYKCSVCGKCFAIISTMKIHMNIHTGLRPYSCDVCKKAFTQSTSLTLHKRVHSGEKPFKCDICGKCFSQSGSLRVHKRVHTGEKPYLCTVCGHGFSQLTGLNLHKKTHDRVSCNLCSKSFANREKLMKHEELHDSDKKES